MEPQNTPLQNFPDETLDLKRYFFLFLGKWYFIAISVFAGLFVAYLVNRYSEQVYSVKATLLVGNASAPSRQGVQSLMREMSLGSDRKMIENEIGVLKSYTLARTAIEELPDFKITYVSVGRRGIAESKLYNRSPFVVEIDTAAANPINTPIYFSITSNNGYVLDFGDGNEYNVNFGEKFQNELYSFVINKRRPQSFEHIKQSNRYYFIINSNHNLAIIYMRKLSVQLNESQGSLLTLSSQGYVAQQEADFINKIMEVYVRNDLNNKLLTAENAINFIEEQLKGVSDSLIKAELQLQNYRTEKGIFNLSYEGMALLERLEKFYSEKNILILQTEYFNYLESYLIDKKDLNNMISPASIGIDEIGITTIVTNINQLLMEKEVLQMSIKEDNIQLVKLDIKLNNLINLLLEKTKGMREINRIKKFELDKKIADQEVLLRALPVTERELLNMERKFSIHEKFYTYLMEKRIEAGIAKASNVSDNKVIDLARGEMASIIKPKRKHNYTLGLLIGILLPLGIVFLFDIINNTIQDPSNISQKTQVPLLGAIGHNPYESFLPVYDKPKSSFAESFRALRTNLDFMLGKEEKKVILVSSTISGEGKSFMASNLAISLAMLGKKTALLGLDLRKPKVHNLFSVDNSRGISTYLIGRDKWDDLVSATNIPNLYVLPAGPIPPNPAELLASSKLDELFAELKKNFDYIVIDSAPVAVVTDAVLISRLCDTTLFVLRHRYTSRNVLSLVEDLSKNKTIANMALLLNDFKKPKGYGYGYNYGYGYSYGYNYGYDSSYGYGEGYYTDEENGGKVIGFIKRFFG